MAQHEHVALNLRQPSPLLNTIDNFLYLASSLPWTLTPRVYWYTVFIILPSSILETRTSRLSVTVMNATYNATFFCLCRIPLAPLHYLGPQYFVWRMWNIVHSAFAYVLNYYVCKTVKLNYWTRKSCVVNADKILITVQTDETVDTITYVERRTGNPLELSTIMVNPTAVVVGLVVVVLC